MLFELGSSLYYFCPNEPHVNEPHWTAYLSALLTPTVAVLGSFIAYRQWRTAQNKLKLDLFDRRFAIYESSRKLLASIATTGKVKDEELIEFLTNTRGAQWLLNTEIAEYLDKELYERAVDLQTVDYELEGLNHGTERNNLVQKRREIKQLLYQQYKTMNKKFSPFLQLDH